jgi:hypothetical protein
MEQEYNSRLSVQEASFEGLSGVSLTNNISS